MKKLIKLIKTQDRKSILLKLIILFIACFVYALFAFVFEKKDINILSLIFGAVLLFFGVLFAYFSITGWINAFRIDRKKRKRIEEYEERRELWEESERKRSERAIETAKEWERIFKNKE